MQPLGLPWRERAGGVVLVAVAILLLTGLLPGIAVADHTGSPAGVIDGFEIDGNFPFDGHPGGTRDWANVPGVVMSVDDDGLSFKGGSKDDNPGGWQLIGEQVPGKADIVRVYRAVRPTTTTAYLWLGFERLTVQGKGDVHIDFELNRSRDMLAIPGGSVPRRTAGDLRIAYDYSGGTGPVEVTLFSWSGDHLNGTWVASSNPSLAKVGDINREPIVDPSGRTVGERRFGELGIDLAAAFGPGFAMTCPGFSTFWTKGRSSGESETATLQERTAPQNVDISVCGQLQVRKIDAQRSPGGLAVPLAGATFELLRDTGAGPQPFTPARTCTTPASGVCLFDQLDPGGGYYLDETSPPPGYDAGAMPVGPFTVTAFETHEVDVENDESGGGGGDQIITYQVNVTPPNAANLVDFDHVFTVEVLRDTDGGGYAPVVGVFPTLVVSPTAHLVGTTCTGTGAPGTDADGRCTVTIRSSAPGSTTVTASYQEAAGTGQIVFGGESSGGKRWVDYRIQVESATATNVVDDPHTFEVTLEIDEGAGWAPADAETVAIGLVGVGGITAIQTGPSRARPPAAASPTRTGGAG